MGCQDMGMMVMDIKIQMLQKRKRKRRRESTMMLNMMNIRLITFYYLDCLQKFRALFCCFLWFCILFRFVCIYITYFYINCFVVVLLHITISLNWFYSN